MQASVAEAGAKIDHLAEAQRRALAGEVDSMTKAQLQGLAAERAIAGVDQTRQTKAEMLAVIRQALLG